MNSLKSALLEPSLMHLKLPKQYLIVIVTVLSLKKRKEHSTCRLYLFKLETKKKFHNIFHK